VKNKGRNRVPVAKEEPPLKPAAGIREVKKRFVDHDDTKEHAREILKKTHQGRKNLRAMERLEHEPVFALRHVKLIMCERPRASFVELI
jgi:hypothetical protein